MKSITIRAVIAVKKQKNRILLAAAAILAGLLLAEIPVRAFDLDWRVVRRMLSYQWADRGSHEAVDDPDLLFRLKPGVTDYPKYRVTINSLRFRGLERTARKPPGVFRILCYGGSNVYGLGYQDDEAWPARLETRLNAASPGRYEVWNGGACAYVPGQMAIVAREGIEKFDPDLILFGLSNAGGPVFPSDTPVAPHFRKSPILWERLFTRRCLSGPVWFPYNARLFLIRFSRVFRFAEASLILEKTECRWFDNPEHETRNIEVTREFFMETRGKVPLVVFLYPGCRKNIDDFRNYTKGLNLPILELRADGLAEEYWDIHPSPPVTLWYAETIAQWLSDHQFLPGGQQEGKQGFSAESAPSMQ